MRTLGPQIAATTLKIYALIIIVTSLLACVRPINAGVRMCVVCCARLRADVRMDESDGQATAVCEESRKAPHPPQWICARRVLGASL